MSAVKNTSGNCYGVRRKCEPGETAASSSPELERIWDAAGLSALAGTDSQTVQNDFDSIYPWCAMRRCNIQGKNGKGKVQAYEGEPSFASDGSNGSVAVEIPLFFTPPRFPGDGYEYWGVSAEYQEGWQVNPVFLAEDGTLLTHTYIAAYESSLDEMGRMCSISGRYPLTEATITQFRDSARKVGANLYDLAAHVLLETLFAVEFATLDSGQIMAGACRMPYSNLPEDSIRNTECGCRAVVSQNYAREFVTGQTIGIGLKRGRNQIVKARTVTEINADTGEIFFDGEPLPMQEGQYIYNQGWKSGSTDMVAASSGSPVSNTSGKYCCKYRGIENIWGNLYKWVDGCSVLNHQVYVCTNPEHYGSECPQDYVQLKYTIALENGFPTALGYDPDIPWVRLPVAVGGDNSSFTCEYYYQGDGKTTLRIGGHWGTPNASGLFSYAPCSPEEYCGTAITGRMAWRAEE